MGKYPDYWPKQMQFRNSQTRKARFNQGKITVSSMAEDIDRDIRKNEKQKEKLDKQINSSSKLPKGTNDRLFKDIKAYESRTVIQLSEVRKMNNDAYIIVYSEKENMINCFYGDYEISEKVYDDCTEGRLEALLRMFDHMNQDGKQIYIISSFDFDGVFVTGHKVDSVYKKYMLAINTFLKLHHMDLTFYYAQMGYKK